MELSVIERFEKSLNNIVDAFMSMSGDFFFTEKELHSYFYHFCLSENLVHRGFNLVHTEYPTPFKCETHSTEPFITVAGKSSKNQRAHVDLVLLNPTYIDFTLMEKPKESFKYLTGIGAGLFSSYIVEFEQFFSRFAQECGESVLLYAVEFKYHRHAYSGEKYPAKELKQDIHKLGLLKEFEIGRGIPFCSKTRSLVFVGPRIGSIPLNSMRTIAADNPRVCTLTVKR